MGQYRRFSVNDRVVNAGYFRVYHSSLQENKARSPYRDIHIMATKELKIDFVSDVTCPWCAVGLGGLEQALGQLQDEVTADIRFQPFELNPDMPAEGQDAIEHLSGKYGTTAEQQRDIRQAICERGAQVGFEFNPEGRGRIWNTFDAHRLLYFAETEADTTQQTALKKALLAACHTQSEAMGDHQVLTRCAVSAGLDAERVKAVLASDEYAVQVRERQRFYAKAFDFWWSAY